jgi:trigger factor
MNIELKELEYCKYQVDYVAESKKVSEKRSVVLDSFKNAPVRGYRKGKAPNEVLTLFYKSQIEESLKRALCEDAYHDTVFEKELKTLGSPSFQSMLIKDNKFYCTFTLDTRPNFDLQDYKTIAVAKPEVKVTQQELIDRRIKELQETFGDPSLFTVDDFVEDSDRLVVDYEAFDGDQKIDLLCKTSDVVKVGESLQKNFTDNLLGMKVNEERKFKYVVDEKSMPSLSGKEVEFNVKLVAGTKVKLAEVNDELAAKVGASSIEDLKAQLLKAANALIASQIKQHINQQVSSILVESHQFKIQDWLVGREYAYLLQSSKLNDKDLVEEDKQMYTKMADKNLRLSLVLEKIREAEPEAQLSETEVMSMLRSSLGRSMNLSSDEQFLEYLQKMGPYVQVLFAKIRDEHTLDFVSKSVTIKE